MENKSLKEITLHHILTYSYLVFFIFALLSVVLSINYGIFDQYSYSWGLTLLVWGSAFIYWAQITSRKTFHKEKGDPSHPYFLNGPYKFSRTPTHLGLLVLVCGLGMMMGYYLVIASAFLSFLVTRYTFVHFQEKKLKSLYGEKYADYKKSVLL